jgi:pimeloyl-ACP methyl ester carboxylesterase/ketosteroid isomerase-like protein
MTGNVVAGLALLVLGSIAQPVTAQPSAPGVVHVAPPTGERATDRASILAALERVPPGGTVQFAAGTYVTGEIIRVGVPRITLLGHEDGTAVRGCDPSEYLEQAVVLFTCAGFELSAGHQTVRNLTFEYTSHGLFVGCCWFDNPDDAESGEGRQPRLAQPGGHVIEGNTFRFASNPIRVIGASAEPILIRGNRFVNSYHVVSVMGGAVHFLDNDVAVPEPGQVPIAGHPGGAVAMLPFGSMLPPWNRSADEDTSCSHNVIAGNRIEGHPDAIYIGAHAGSSCRHNIIRDNTLIVRPTVRGADMRIVGVPLAIRSTDSGLIEDNHVDGNRIAGAEGLGIEVFRASRNRISNNLITGISRRDPFPGSAYWRDASPWREGNGSGIWLSPGSDENEIVGNTFEDIATDAIVVEGERNRVETRSTGDAVRDLGSGNVVVSSPAPPSAHEEVEALTARFVRYLDDESWRSLAPFYAPDAVLALPGRVVLEGREAILDYFRPVVARIRGVEATTSALDGDERTVTVTTPYTARFAPATHPAPATFSNTWARQPDGSWLIVAGTFELPGHAGVESHGTVRSGYFHSDDVRLHYLEFGGEGVPVLFISSGDRTAYAFMEFAPRFTDRNRVLALSQRGAGPSEGEPAPVVDPTVLGRDIVTLLDSAGIERAVVAHMWQEVLVYLAEEHPQRLAGLVFLGGGVPDPEADWRGEDPIGLLRMLERSRAAIWGADRDASPTWGYAPRYLETGASVGVPALLFVDEARSVEDGWEEIMGYARLASVPEAAPLFPDTLARQYFERLAADEEMQERGRSFWREVVEPVQRAAEEGFYRAFGGSLRTVAVESRAIGYGYRDAPDAISPHIRQFLHEVWRRERR